MIQRIQTVYLLLVVILTGVMLGSDLLILKGVDQYFTLSSYKLYDNSGIAVDSTGSLSVLIQLCLVLGLVTVFLYKKRMFQIRLSIFNLVLQAGIYVMIFFYFNSFSKQYDLEFDAIKIAVLFPAINIILLILTIRSIGKDEALIRSLNRIR